MSIVMFRDSGDSDEPGRTGQAVCIDSRRWRSFHDGWLVRYDDTCRGRWWFVGDGVSVGDGGSVGDGCSENKFLRDLRDPISFDAG